MLVNAPSLADLEQIHAVMQLPEPLVFCHLEDGAIAGLITGWIRGTDGLASVEHMIVLPTARRKFQVMMAMSRDATSALHARGLDVVLQIRKSDTRSGLHAWAKRLKYLPYYEDHEASWFVNRKEPVDGKAESAEAEGPARRA